VIIMRVVSRVYRGRRQRPGGDAGEEARVGVHHQEGLTQVGPSPAHFTPLLTCVEDSNQHQFAWPKFVLYSYMLISYQIFMMFVIVKII